jgi:iron complex transport system substrate-binding protein
MRLRVSPLAALSAAIIAAAVLVSRAAPADLIVSPTRPYQGHGNPLVRMEGTPLGVPTSDPRAYPRAATGADDVRVRVDRAPQRIVSQHWSTDDFLYAVVPPERIVGVSEASYLERISNVTEILKRHRPIVANDVERVLRAQPDLVFTPSDARSDMPALLRHAGVPVYRSYTMFETLDAIEEHIRLVGYLTGEDARAEDAAQRFRDTITRAVARRPAGITPPRVMAFNAQYTYGSQTLFADILRVLGAENVAATHGLLSYDRVTDEHIVRWDPEWIVTGADAGQTEAVRARLLDRPSIAATTAARRGQVVVLEYRVFLPLSPMAAQLVDALSQALFSNVRSAGRGQAVGGGR